MIKRVLVSTLFFIFFLINPIFAFETQGMKTDSIEIFPDGAMVKFRIGSLGPYDINIPGTFDKGSIRYISSGDIEITNFEIQEKTVIDWIPPSLKDLDSSISQIINDNRSLTAEIQGLEQSIQYLQELSPSNIADGEFESFIDRLQKKRIDSEKLLLQKQEQLKKNRNRIEVLQSKYNSMEPPDNEKYFHVSINSAGKGDLYLQAWTSNAGWKPEYEMNLNSISGNILIELQARVFQRTGIDFQGRLTFHTVNHRTNLTFPQLRPQVVDFLNEIERSGFSSDLSTLKSNRTIPVAKEIQLLEDVTDLSIQSRGSIPGTGMPVNLYLGSDKQITDVSIVAIPAISGEPWVTAEITNLETPLIPASVNLFVDGKPGGSTRIKGYVRGDNFEIPFGKTPLIPITKDNYITKEETNWTGKGRMKRGYIIEIFNGLEDSIDLILKDRIPVSARDDIQIENIEIDPEPVEISKKNLLSWEFNMAPGERKIVEVSYTIKYPSNKDIVLK